MLKKVNVPYTSAQCIIFNCFKKSLHLYENNKNLNYYKENAFNQIVTKIVENKDNNNDKIFFNYLKKSIAKTRSNYFVPRFNKNRNKLAFKFQFPKLLNSILNKKN